jgi:hypothetical protein
MKLVVPAVAAYLVAVYFIPDVPPAAIYRRAIGKYEGQSQQAPPAATSDIK